MGGYMWYKRCLPLDKAWVTKPLVESLESHSGLSDYYFRGLMMLNQEVDQAHQRYKEMETQILQTCNRRKEFRATSLSHFWTDDWEEEAEHRREKQRFKDIFVSNEEVLLEDGYYVPNSKTDEMEQFEPGEELPYIEATRKKHGR